MENKSIVYIDIEVDKEGEKILDVGAITGDGQEFHSNSLKGFSNFIRDHRYACGHNIFNHDLLFLKNEIFKSNIEFIIDTLYLSPLLFPKEPYHKLIKDDKLSADELNNPLNDAKKARDLLYDEYTAFNALDRKLKQIYFNLLCKSKEFKDFFRYFNIAVKLGNTVGLIHETFLGKICINAPIEKIVEKYPVELAYALAQINVIAEKSITPPWVLRNYSRVENILNFLRNKSCRLCPYCNEALNESKALKRYFNFDDFRSYDGVPLQQDAVRAAVDGKSVIVIFPTGGGKSITFQLPALMAGANEKGLTVIISPLQSLMKDQTDNLENNYNIINAVAIHGSLDPLERANAFERVADGTASILYISPESLRLRSIELLLLKRNVVRFVIDEAHCLSAWGQDFRVDYLYIGDYINSLQSIKGRNGSIAVSCFTATAKHNVVADIIEYFKQKLSLNLELFQANSARKNLTFHIFTEENENDKDIKLRQLLQDFDCPTVVYVSRRRRAGLLAGKLTSDGFHAKPYHAGMDRQERRISQDDFMSGKIKIIVATSAFGMGVDKKDIRMVIHYDISSSLEDYVQEAGRAGRDENISADCFVLYSDEDLNKHFALLNQTKLSRNEIQQVWMGIKKLTVKRSAVSQSALEIARSAGWDDSVSDIETRVSTAVSALEQSGFIKRGQNMPRIFADSILEKSMIEARARIDASARFDDASRQNAIRIMSRLFSAKSKAISANEEGEARIDYISDILGIVKEDVIRVIGLLREEKILADAKDLVAFIGKSDKGNHSEAILSKFIGIERFLFEYLNDDERKYNIKEMNEALHIRYPESSVKQLNLILNYYDIKRLVMRTHDDSKNYTTLKPYFPIHEIHNKSNKRFKISEFILSYLFTKSINDKSTGTSDIFPVEFSVLEIKDEFNHNLFIEKAETDEIEDALYYLLRIGALKIEGGFLVIYNAMRIERLEMNNKNQYLNEHYTNLKNHYQNKRQQIHIIGEYAKRLIDDYDTAQLFVDDYFTMDYDLFLNKYFRGRRNEINQNITQAKYQQLFGELSAAQVEIINDQDSKYIAVAAGPGSGKTKLLTHKLASLYMMEDVKHEQMLMLTFSRAATTEFKKRLMGLIGNAAHYIQIMTFHSFCFDLLGKVGDLEKSDVIIKQTVEKILAGEVDESRITKTVLVIDEAQDMSEAEYSLVKTLMELNDGLRIIAVGDDDQNIFEFRGSDSKFFKSLLDESDSKKYELIENYRSKSNIIHFANSFVKRIKNRFKSKSIIPVVEENGEIHIC
ncbi:MAG: RecQ family ATP-dependent DNA helicase, partial [Oscillospiraceae bacterium]|nr:RecQ family ATP-dependent DNA helicase [Oscillospiraceae bacterium]